MSAKARLMGWGQGRYVGRGFQVCVSWVDTAVVVRSNPQVFAKMVLGGDTSVLYLIHKMRYLSAAPFTHLSQAASLSGAAGKETKERDL